MLYQTEHAGKAYQNPILRIESGSRFTASLDNALPEPTIIHWHGLHTPAAMDGHPASTIAPGGRYDYDFTVRNRGGTYWYHTHAHGLTAKQAYQGLASFFLVDDDDQRRLSKALDLRLGVTGLPLVIQDKQFDAQGKLRYQPNAQESMMGWLGDMVLANLTLNAVQTVTPRTYRLRLLNGSNARIYRLAFITGRKQLNFTVIGTDGGLIERPKRRPKPFSPQGSASMSCWMPAKSSPARTSFSKAWRSIPRKTKDLPCPACRREWQAWTTAPGTRRQARPRHGCRWVWRSMCSSSRSLRGKRILPGTLSKVSPISIQGATQRKIELSLENMCFLINGRTFVMDEIAFDVKRGTVEVWSISNPELGMPHPMHIHGFSFQVLERLNSPHQVSSSARFGKGRTAGDLGWKDTVLAWPGETVRIAIDFTNDFPGNQTYLLHCHNLEHEDAGNDDQLSRARLKTRTAPTSTCGQRRSC